MLNNNCNLNIERAVLSAIIFENELILDISDRLFPKHFYLPFHREVYSAMLELVREDKPIDEIFIQSKIKKIDEMALIDIMASHPISTISAYIDILIEKYRVREFNQLSMVTKKMIEEGTESTEIEAQIQSKIKELDNSSSDSGYGDELMKEFEEFMNDDIPVEYIDTGLQRLNGLFGGGFEKSEIITIGARPSVGKTSYITTLIGHLVKKGVGVFFDSLEMPRLPISRRILSAMSSNPLSELKKRQIVNLKAYREAFEALKTKDLVVHDQRGDSAFLRAKARRVLRANPNIKVWIIDHLGELVYDKKQPLRLEIGAFMSDIRDIAKEFNITVIVLSQLRRDAENRKPTMADLRESGEIEQKSDKIIFLHREDYGDTKQPKKDFLETSFIVSKNRDGMVGEIKAYLEPKYTRFVNYKLKIEESKNVFKNI